MAASRGLSYVQSFDQAKVLARHTPAMEDCDEELRAMGDQDRFPETFRAPAPWC